jgi:hypothetical protein
MHIPAPNPNQFASESIPTTVTSSDAILFAEPSGVKSGSKRLLFFDPESALDMRSGYTDDTTVVIVLVN